MKSAEQSGLDSAIASLPSTLQDSVGQWVDRLCDIDDSARDWFDAAPAEKNSLLRLVGSSEFAGRVLLREWSWFTSALSGNGMYRAVGANALQDIIDDLLLNARGEEDLRAQLRRIRNRQLLHVLWRGLNGAATLRKSLHDLSDVADALITAAVRGAEAMLSPRFGLPHDSAGQVIPPVVLAMGKLGGRELNFSSDIDIIFLYRDDGNTDGPKSLSAHEYFTRLSRKVVALLDEVTEDGFVYRVDTRLRPFGDSGPPVTSFAALESYLLQHARGWERYAYVKARVVTPRGDAAIHEELVGGIIEPFVYRQYLDFGVFESLRDMKTMISAEVQRRELAGNIKLGPGGIREIEFITQALQLVRGGRDRALRNPALLDVLPQLANGKGLRRESVDKLMNAYEFLRKLENAVQALKDRQVHETPDDPVDQSRLVLAMDYADWPALQRDFDRHRKMVAAEFAGLLFGAEDDAAPPAAADELAALWGSSASTEQWVAGFARLDFPDPQAMADLIGHFADASIHRQLDRMARRRLARFMPLLLQQLLDRRAGHVVLERVLNVTTQILRRSAYVSLLNENPPVLGRLIDLCENSAYLAGEIARYPVLLDELLDPRVYSTAISVAEMREELADRLRRIDADDSERQIEALGQMQRAFLFRIALSDHSGTLPIMKVSDRLTELAELVLEHALQIAWRDLTRQHGAPVYQAESGAMKAGFAVIAYGKLGGMELSYYSDLDLVFLHDSHGERQETDGPKPLDNSLFFSRLVRRLIHFLTAQTASGALYDVDTRLRPSGRSGLLVSTVEGFERYQEENAWTWEHQALLRSRPVAGSGAIARAFERVRADTLRHRVHHDRLREDVLSMRARMREQLDRSDDEHFDLKQGAGGIGDIEFLVQYLVLKNAREHPAVLHFPDNIRQLGTLGATACLPERDVLQLQDIYRRYRHRLHRLALDELRPIVPAAEFAEEQAVVGRIWQRELA